MESMKVVYKAKDLVDALQAQAVLDSQKINYFVQNQYVQSLFGVGQFGTGFNVAVGQILIKVHTDEFQESKKLLEANIINKTEEADSELSEILTYNRFLNTAVVLGLFVPGLNLIPLIIALKIKSKSSLKLKGTARIIVSILLVTIGGYFGYQMIF